MSTPGWPLKYTMDVDGAPFEVRARYAVRGPLGNAYPAGVADLEIDIEGLRDAQALTVLGRRILADHPACRRVVLPVAAGDLVAIGHAEDAGFRYVVDVDVRGELSQITELSLMVLEPGWVTEIGRSQR
ncbi:hypothetical protein ERC79_05490 [Rhodococcus sp. ABRD24]|uniref:hypothetical protein n=1 Tax=Rhodococcus sp. ABRD24 TaxID=2507582 RepID=UPI00103E40A6|nr:hypothetical protein [Rhodococcus sp. ABRD24]QBJ95474.1 hypothetical protein ERC79_05490 [Rhodococcus sp. ABRD24]